MAEHLHPTDPELELELGRVPLWLDAHTVRALTKACICGQPRGYHEQPCSHLRWRADVVLHKAGGKVRLRRPEVREALAGHLRTLARANALYPVTEEALSEAVDEVHHLLDPAHGGEPGDVFRREVEVDAARRLWQALDAAAWPADRPERGLDETWSEVIRRAMTLAHLLRL